MGITIQHEKPQLEVQKTELLRKEEELKVQLAELEESLLEVTFIYYTPLSTKALSTRRHRKRIDRFASALRFRLSTLKRSKTIELHVVTYAELYAHATSTRLRYS